MAHNAEHGSRGAMTAHAAPAPGTTAAIEVDFTDDPLADQIARIRGDYFADELMAGDAGKPVVAALEFEIGVADSRLDQADQGEAFGPFRLRHLADVAAPTSRWTEIMETLTASHQGGESGATQAGLSLIVRRQLGAVHYQDIHRHSF